MRATALALVLLLLLIPPAAAIEYPYSGEITYTQGVVESHTIENTSENDPWNGKVLQMYFPDIAEVSDLSSLFVAFPCTSELVGYFNTEGVDASGSSAFTLMNGGTQIGNGTATYNVHFSGGYPNKIYLAFSFDQFSASGSGPAAYNVYFTNTTAMADLLQESFMNYPAGAPPAEMPAYLRCYKASDWMFNLAGDYTFQITHEFSHQYTVEDLGDRFQISINREGYYSNVSIYDEGALYLETERESDDVQRQIPKLFISGAVTLKVVDVYGNTYYQELVPADIGDPTSPTLYGNVIDIYTGDPIAGAVISISQPTIGYTLTTSSTSTGSYTTAGLPGSLRAGYPVTITTNITGYYDACYSFEAAPERPSWYVPLYLVPGTAPDDPIEEGKAMLYGYVITQGSQQPIAGATISIEGVDSTTTTSTGFYQINNVTPATYSVSATAPGHTPLTESVTIEAPTTQHNLALSGIHTLTVTVKDADTLKTLTNATTISLSDGQETNDLNPATFSVGYGQCTITAAASGYYPGSQSVYIDDVGATTATVLLTAHPEPTPAPEYPNYPPHNVKFTIQTLLGTPIPGVNVTAQGIQQTPSTNIIERLLGINMTSTPINSEAMTGTTDTNGEINFMMVEAVKYQISIYKPDVVNQTLEIYPKEDTYPIIISTAGGPLLPDAGDALRDIRINVTTSTEGDTGHILVDYNDTTLKTTGLTIQVTQQNTTNTSAPEDVIASYTVANDANVTHTFDLSVYKGQSFFVRLEAEHPDFGTINRDYAVAFKGVRVPLGPLPDGLYIYVAGFGLMLLGGIFGATSATRGVVVIAFAGWLFYAFGWLDDLGLIAPASLGLVSTIAVMGVIVTRYKEEGYT